MVGLLKTTRTVLGRHKMPYDAVDAVEATMRQSKANIDTLLGLSEATLFRARLSLDKSEETVRKEYPYTLGVIAHILKEAINAGAPIDMATMSLTKNVITVKKQEQRLSKVLAKYLPGHEEVVMQHCQRELKINKVEQFLPKLGDIVKSGRALFLSTNILDFLTASDNAAFRSCHSMDGQHYNGNIAYTRDQMTVLTFVAEASFAEKDHEIHKLGRSWMFVAPPKIVQPKSYGAYYDNERKLARQYVIERIANNAGLDPNEYKLKVDSYSANNYTAEAPEDKNGPGMAGYFDAAGLEIAYHGKDASLPKLKFAAATCLVCGKTTNYARKGVCSEHDGRVRFTCAGCGERHLAENCVAVGDVHYCQRCHAERFVTCNHCRQSFTKDQIQKIDGHNTCPACLKKHYTECGGCGKLHRKEKLTALQGVEKPVCNACIENYLLCSICGDYHPADQVEYYRHIGRTCAKCVEKVATTCGGCGEIHLNTELKDVDGGKFCAACVGRREGKEVVLKDKPKYAGLPEGWDDFVEEIG